MFYLLIKESYKGCGGFGGDIFDRFDGLEGIVELFDVFGFGLLVWVAFCVWGFSHIIYLTSYLYY